MTTRTLALCLTVHLISTLSPRLVRAAGSCEECKDNCPACQGCNPDLATCNLSCEACFSLCEEDCPYWNSTPICNYLDRGIDDHMISIEDQYVVFQENVEFLSDLDRLRFGLDLPATHCVANPHGIPCADKDYSVEWLIDSVRLSAAGVPLFFETKAPNAPFLLSARGGFADEGMVGWDRGQLRANPMWGLSENDVNAWYSTLPLPNASGVIIDLQPGTSLKLRQITADELSRLIEGILGRRLAQRNKRADCEGHTYCDNADGQRVYWRDAITSNAPECDLGGCPSQNLRRPSPWFEIRRSGDGQSLVVDVDLEVVQSIPDLADCPFGAPCPPSEYGLNYVGLASVGVRVTFGFECVETTGGVFVVRMVQTSLALDGGFLDPIVEALAPASLESELADATNLDLPFEYPSCPSPGALVSIAADGGLTFAAPPKPLGSRWFPGSKLVRYARWLTVPPATEPRLALRNAFNQQHVANISWSETLPPDVASNISGTINVQEKRRFSEIEAAYARTAALGIMCPSLDFANLEIPPPDIDPAEAVLCSPFTLTPVNTERCRQLGWFKAFALQPVVRQCFIDNGVAPNNADYAEEYGLLLGIIEGLEASLPPIETQVPVPNLILDVRTGHASATDGFAFVDFQDPALVSTAQRDSDGCRNRFDQTLTPDPYEYPDCSDPDDESSFGELGCPCKDIDIISSSETAFDGGYSDGEGSHAAHGVNGVGQYCDDGSGTGSSSEVVCGAVRQQGKKWPVCVECGADTKLGCRCDTDLECQGFEPDLICWGSETDGDWPGQNGGGKCLPAPEGEDGREALEEVPWFCLDNCQSLADFQNWVEPACIYNQTGAHLAHGTCVELEPSVPGCMAGECEEMNLVCRNGACVSECMQDGECAGLGFPPHYVCDGTAHCVPPDCGGAGIGFSYCQLFR